MSRCISWPSPTLQLSLAPPKMSHHLPTNGLGGPNGVGPHNFLNNPQSHYGLPLGLHHSEPTSEQDAEADADADEDMSYLPAAAVVAPITTPAPRPQKIDLQAVDPVLYGLRRSVRSSPSR